MQSVSGRSIPDVSLRHNAVVVLSALALVVRTRALPQLAPRIAFEGLIRGDLEVMPHAYTA
eukprot:1443687-Rhodomonas_salina.3